MYNFFVVVFGLVYLYNSTISVNSPQSFTIVYTFSFIELYYCIFCIALFEIILISHSTQKSGLSKFMNYLSLWKFLFFFVFRANPPIFRFFEVFFSSFIVIQYHTFKIIRLGWIIQLLVFVLLCMYKFLMCFCFCACTKNKDIYRFNHSENNMNQQIMRLIRITQWTQIPQNIIN